jgi:tRNA A37 threonylcarbamoyladenosine dehydratase
LRTGTAFITCGAAGGKRLAHRTEVGDLADTSHDPLLASLRQRLRRDHGGPRSGRIGVACVFSRESVALPGTVCAPEGNAAASAPSAASDGSLNCHGYGSSVTVTASFGLAAVGWLIESSLASPA